MRVSGAVSNTLLFVSFVLFNCISSTLKMTKDSNSLLSTNMKRKAMEDHVAESFTVDNKKRNERIRKAKARAKMSEEERQAERDKDAAAKRVRWESMTEEECQA